MLGFSISAIFSALESVTTYIAINAPTMVKIEAVICKISPLISTPFSLSI